MLSNDSIAFAANSGEARIHRPLALALVLATATAASAQTLPIRTLAGNSAPGSTNGFGSNARFNRPSAVAADNPTLEVAPGDPQVGSLHRRLIPLLGFVVGELLDFERLAPRCGSERRWDFMFVAMPLNLPGGVGSPANAMAIR